MKIKSLLMSMLFACTALMAAAQGEIQFSIARSIQDGLSQDVVETLDLRLKQIFSRNGAAAANVFNVFVIEPKFEITDELTTEGLMDEVSLVNGELTLVAKNSIDNAIYYTMVMPVKGSNVGGKQKAMLNLIKNIKYTDPKFTRFIRTTRQKIADYYAANCAVIVQRGQLLFEQGEIETAQAYLSGVGENLPCYEQARAILLQIAKVKPTPNDTVLVEVPVEVPVPVAVPTPTPEPAPDPQPAPAVDPWADCELSVSVNDLDVRILGCTGNITQRRVTLQLEVVNRNPDSGDGWLRFLTAITSDGVECAHKGSMGDRYETHVKMPTGIELKQNYYVLKVDQDVRKFSYVELSIRGAKIVIKNLPVTVWE